MQIVRQHVVQAHTMRMCNTERAEKTAALYDFITSERCARYSHGSTAKHKNCSSFRKRRCAHESHWKREGELCRNVQKARADLSAEIDRIIATNADAGRP